MAAEDYIDLIDPPEPRDINDYDVASRAWWNEPINMRRKFPMKVINKYYCGAKDILTNGWARNSEVQAIDHAKELLMQDEYRDHVVIVKIVKIVRRVNPTVQIKIEEVK